MSILDYVDGSGYLRYDTEDNTIKENESTYFDIQEDLRALGLELDEVQVEHDCITGYVIPLSRSYE